jgi:hypothetical protein
MQYVPLGSDKAATPEPLVPADPAIALGTRDVMVELTAKILQPSRGTPDGYSGFEGSTEISISTAETEPITKKKTTAATKTVILIDLIF